MSVCYEPLVACDSKFWLFIPCRGYNRTSALHLSSSINSEHTKPQYVNSIVNTSTLLTYLATFVQTLCQRLTVLLKEQYEYSVERSCDWLLQTANCGEDIQSSGTFRKAVNLRINNTIAPLLSELIACVDRNGNLELALCNEQVPECLLDLWQDIFRDERLLVLQYRDTVSPHTLLPRRRVPVLSDGAGGKYFKAHFPFSWLINECASHVLSEIKNLSG